MHEIRSRVGKRRFNRFPDGLEEKGKGVGRGSCSTTVSEKENRGERRKGKKRIWNENVLERLIACISIHIRGCRKCRKMEMYINKQT